MDSRRLATAPALKRSTQNVPPDAHGTTPAHAAMRVRDTAEYLSEMILELRNLARAHKLYTVMVPLEYAYYEAFGAANRVEIPADELERIRELSQASLKLEGQAKA